MMIKPFLALVFASFVTFSFSQKKKIDHTVYDDWNTLEHVSQSHTGKVISYEINPHRGDGTLYIENMTTQMKKPIARGKAASIQGKDQFVVFKIVPEFDTLRKLKLDGVKKANLPKDTLGIYLINSDSLITFPNVKSFQLSDKYEHIVYLSEKDEQPDCPPQKKCFLFRKKVTCHTLPTSGTSLHIFNPISGQDTVLHRVTDYALAEKENKLIYITSHKGKEDTLSLHYLNLSNFQHQELVSKQLSIKALNFDEDNEQVVFLTSTDTSKNKYYQLGYWHTQLEKAELVLDTNSQKIPRGYSVSPYHSPYFSKNGSRILLGIGKLPEPETEDTLLDNEKAQLDVWSGNDLRIQPQQLLERKKDLRKSWLSIYQPKTSDFVILENDTLEQVKITQDENGTYGLGYVQSAYQKSNTWDYPWKRDVYRISVETGQTELVKKAQAYGTSLSPKGDIFVWYNGIDTNWYAFNFITNDTLNLTQNIDAEFAANVNGNPFIPYSQGSPGWSLINDSLYFIVYSQYDIWALSPQSPLKSFSLTQNLGEKERATYRLQRFDYDSTYIHIDLNMIHRIDSITKAESYYSIKRNNDGKFKMRKLIESNHKFVYLRKAKESDQLLFRRMSFQDYPELESANTDFENIRKHTLTNPQQADYNWGTVDFETWTGYNNETLRGLLYKPEDFDSTRSYPMIVYFYEDYSDRLHYHYIPKPTASIVYPTEYVSNDYVIFIPDITYESGHPGQSAYDCIVSGTDYLTKKYSWIDSTRMGLQGQSWGGYQTAQLITMTNKYAAAMAGAPVSNMFSAYGGVRWGSGLSRMFQYERTQSRIGFTIWEKPNLYFENSPLFHLPKVQTPLLIMHNDGDGAVPWYQGIELYMGLRRLNQPVWLLNYNGDAHNLMQDANRRDLSIRMRQFFDYYLQNASIPQWMENGVPAVDKGTNYGLELKKNN